MSNMGYCRFTNTLQDLRECLNDMNDALSEEEAEARKKLIKLCHKIADQYSPEDFE